MNPPETQRRTHTTHRSPWTRSGAVTEPELDAATGGRILLEALGVDLDN